MKRKKILYLMHVPWGWIKQRPHFIAEGLSERADVKVVTTRSFSKKNLLKNETTVDLVKLFRIPFERFTLIHAINRFLYRLQLKRYLKEVDIIWVTSPSFVSWIPKVYFQKKTIVYDCMDDFLEFPQIKQNSNRLKFHANNERFLVNKASILIASASYLKSKLVSRYGKKEEDITVINNAIREFPHAMPTASLPATLNYYINCTSFKLVYIGTISSWMDFILLKEIVEHFHDVEIFLFGPTEIAIPQIERIHYCGKIEHDSIFKVMDLADVLMMPFVVNELIRSVNPVKLYEYVYSGKPAIAPLYEESKAFEEYIYLYTDAEDCIRKLNEIRTTKVGKSSLIECREFCKKNTWACRMNDIYTLLDI